MERKTTKEEKRMLSGMQSIVNAIVLELEE